jgi:tripartite-type tricarboxylate transporter receptor subunit TctC
MLAVDSGDPKVLMRGGAIRVLATNNPTRNPRFPDLPAVSEYVPGFESRSWHGVLAPAGTPRDRVEKLHAALNAALQQPKIRELVVTSGLTPAGEDPAVFAAVINADLKANSELIRKYNITN